MSSQPYSVAVLSNRGRLHPLIPEEDMLGEKGGAFFNVRRTSIAVLTLPHIFITLIFLKNTKRHQLLVLQL